MSVVIKDILSELIAFFSLNFNKNVCSLLSTASLILSLLTGYQQWT